MNHFEALSVLLAASLVAAAVIGGVLRDMGVVIEAVHILAMAACLAAGVAYGAIAIMRLQDEDQRQPPPD
jgi:hypothetical protein